MFTVCPKCTLTLAVTAADLRAGQGYVRCGRCANVFNALLALTEESAPATADAARAVQDTPSAAVSPGAPAPAPPTQPAVPSLASDQSVAAAAALPPDGLPSPSVAPPSLPPPSLPPALRLVPSPPQPLEAAPVPMPVPATLTPASADWDLDQYQGTGTYETIVLEGDTFLQTEELIPEEALDSQIASVSRRIAEAQDAADHAAQAEQSAPAPPPAAARSTPAAPSPATPLSPPPPAWAAVAANAPRPTGPVAVSAELRSAVQQVNQQLLSDPADVVAPAPAAPPLLRGAWPVAAAVLLALLLAAQAVNHWRNDLATQPAWYGPMSRWSAWFGEPFRPNWDLNAYDVHQLGAAADGTDSRSLHVRLSLANRSEHPQGMPLLRLTLLDRYGKALSAGELTPAQYLPASLRGARLMAREQRVDTEVVVVDPTQQASSFELDVCVATLGGVRCAGDSPAGSP